MNASTESPARPSRPAPGREEARAAASRAARLVEAIASGASVRLQIDADPDDSPLSPFVLNLLVELLQQLGDGKAVAIVPLQTQLSTQQAADVLQVSRPHLVRLLDQRIIPSTRVGTHRRVRIEDVLAYRRQRDEASRQALDELGAQAQDLGMGY